MSTPAELQIGRMYDIPLWTKDGVPTGKTMRTKIIDIVVISGIKHVRHRPPEGRTQEIVIDSFCKSLVEAQAMKDPP
ncbi:MAG TPA: hypothetical protein VHD69_00745 [Candidatus Paceibacterota bacterium]|jgi:hypothetical protein|nr:hypothetical protein [Candidatus Paceibacterota bacterium]